MDVETLRCEHELLVSNHVAGVESFVGAFLEVVTVGLKSGHLR